MLFHQPAHISFGFLRGRAVALDVAADRYYLLAEADAATLAALSKRALDAIDVTCASRLAERGLIGSGPGPAIAPIEMTGLDESALELPGPRERVGTLEAGRAMFGARLSLRAAGLAPTLERWRRLERRIARRQRSASSGSAVSDRDRAAAIARGFAEARMFVPAARRCVPDSLALATCLWRRSAPAELYFGVRLAPFAAHCWVQSGNLLLSDPFDIVREFTPVFEL
ncbi:lasso peptide biosynthesis B2 protein [Sphingopyxis sp.]|uniref:lasso peptide biosynthesis B2 protein n=1 Tax=Sphingopyxis sp. TaxID=1908224 RepID=UPI002FC8B9D4